MEPVFGWVDFVEEDKERMHEFIKALSEQDTRDELGTGSIRDAFSNLFFPGTTTIQTRVKYMLFVPWIYALVEKEEPSDAREAAWISRDLEVGLIETLRQEEDDTGLIGKEAGAELQRMPADIYWTGLKSWGILRFGSSRNDLNNYLARSRQLREYKQLDDDDNPIDMGMNSIWDPGLLEVPEGFPGQASFRLRPEEAVYLYEKIKKNCSGSLLSRLLELEHDEPEYPWEHAEFPHFGFELGDQVRHAQYFAEMIQGANLLYNLMLAEKDEALYADEKEYYRREFRSWQERIRPDLTVYRSWDLDEFWSICLANGNIPLKTRNFFERWLARVVSPEGFPLLPDDRAARNLVYQRELSIKGNRARLQNPRYLQMWGGASSVRLLDYRWPTARSFLRDIKEALTGGGTAYAQTR